MIPDLLDEAWSGLGAHRARSLLSATGILFGVAAVIGILAIGEGARQEQERLIDQLGILNLIVKARDLPEDPQVRAELQHLSPGLRRRDRDVLATVPFARHVGAMRVVPFTELVPRPPDLDALRVIGADPDYLAATRLQRLVGRALGPADERAAAAVCLLGRTARSLLFGAEPALGQKLRVGSTWLTVVGVVSAPSANGHAKSGISLDDRDRDIIVPLATALLRFDLPPTAPELSEVVVSVGGVREVTGAAEVASAMIRRTHKGAEDWDLVVPLQLLEQSRAQQRIFDLVMGLIAGISLLVGGIGIMNIMLATVTERTREIGIRLAVGASPRDIQRLFLAEASLISLGGGFLGILAGFVLARAVASFTGWETAVGADAVALAALVSMLEGVIFGYLPARRASRLQPAEAVRQAT